MARLVYLSLETLQPKRAAATHVHGMIAAFAPLGWDTTLVATVRESSRLGRHIGTLWRYLVLNIRAISTIHKAEAVYVRSHFAAWPTVAFARLVGKPVFYEINGPFNDAIVSFPILKPFSAVIGMLYRQQYRMAHHLFCVTEGLAGWARREAGHGRVSVTPNGYDEAIFNGKSGPRPADLPIEDYVLFYGDIARWHGIDTMCAAIRHEAWPSTLRLIIIGEKPDILRGDDPRIVWLGRKSQHELPAYIGHAVAGLVPITDPDGRSATGVMPLKLVEMLACGLPVIVSDLPGQAELVRQVSCGLVFSAGNAEALAQSVAHIVNDSDCKAMGMRGKAYAETNLRWSAIAGLANSYMRAESAPD